MEKTGYIYVLTNESFHKDNWVKIGYAEDVEKRVRELSGTSVPLPFEVYCTYEIPRIHGVKDPDKLVHDLIQAINPDLRITQNREFFELYPWDAYNMLRAIAQMHDRMDKLLKNNTNTIDQEVQNDTEYSVDALFQKNTEERKLYSKLKELVFSLDEELEEVPRKLYVTFKKRQRNIVSFWPKKGWIEVVLNAKLGQINDPSAIIYDISSRKWSSEQYAFKYYEDSDMSTVADLIKQAIELKK